METTLEAASAEMQSHKAPTAGEGAATSLASRLAAAIAREPGVIADLADALQFYAARANYRAVAPFCCDVVSDGGRRAREIVERVAAERLDLHGAAPIPSAGAAATRSFGDRPRGRRALPGRTRLQEARR